MRTLVTGGAGFIGSHLVDRLLAEAHEVDVIDDLSTGSRDNLRGAQSSGRFAFHELDLRSPQSAELIARRKPEIVFHLAAQMDVRVSVARPVFDAEVNLIGMLNVLEGARAGGTRKVVFASSGGTIYGKANPETLPLTERAPQRPISPYGAAKKAAFDYLVVYDELHGVRFTALALANVYGPRQNPHGEAGVVAIFAGRMLAGQACTIYGDGGKTRDYVYVDDVVDAFARAATRGDGTLFNIGTAVETSDRELHDLMAAAAGSRIAPVHAADRPGDLRRSALDPRLAKAELDWRPATPLDVGVARTIEWFGATRR